MDAVAALRLQWEWGADEALSETPWDRLTPTAAPALRSPVALAPALPAAAAPARARALAQSAATLDALRAALDGFDGCALRATASALVFGDGACAAGLALVGEAPDADSDRSGRAFAGPGGRMLDHMLASIGLGPDDTRRLTLVPWRPPGGRAPTEAEIAACLPFVQRHLALLRPRAVILMGNLACKALGGIEGGARRARGRWHQVSLPGIEAIPAIALPRPEQVENEITLREPAWNELIRLRKFLDGSPLTLQ